VKAQAHHRFEDDCCVFPELGMCLASMNAGGLFQLEKCRYETGVHTQSGDAPKAFTAVQSRGRDFARRLKPWTAVKAQAHHRFEDDCCVLPEFGMFLASRNAGGLINWKSAAMKPSSTPKAVMRQRLSPQSKAAAGILIGA